MKTCLECLPCLSKNALNIVKRMECPEALKNKIVSDSMHMLADCDMSMSPPYYARLIMDIADKNAGGSTGDVYQQEKLKSTQLAEKLLADLLQGTLYHPDDFESRLRLAIAGNIIDFGVFGDLNIGEALRTVESAFTKNLDKTAVQTLKEKMDAANNILYILDNCGEVVFDREFIRPYKDKITLAVRGKPAFNDVLRSDLEPSGLGDFTDVIDNENGVPGVIIEDSGTVMQQAFAKADLIIAKGQGNFETLDETDRPIAFLFMAKCPVVIRKINAKPNSIQLKFCNC